TFGGTGSGGVTLSSNVSGPGSLTKAGTNTLTLAGSNTYSGITTVTGGILRVASGGGIYNGLNNNLAGALTVTNSGVVEFASWTFGNGNSFGSLWDSAANIVVNGGTLRYIGAGNNSGNRSLTIGALGATLESFTAGQTWTIGVSDITNMISASGGLLTLTGVGNGQINQNIPGTGGLTKNGSGTWILAGSNSYSGGTIVSNGVLGVGTTNA
ncbi:MAG: autotransporter-associated beta strand repeat-containing protein, partial [Kiritimatiellaeota bacterium]|nr:autotransporter-associated beta strand repeat-containing protein [Kiritimatiellota bacterium]